MQEPAEHAQRTSHQTRVRTYPQQHRARQRRLIPQRVNVSSHMPLLWTIRRFLSVIHDVLQIPFIHVPKTVSAITRQVESLPFRIASLKKHDQSCPASPPPHS
ncbi:hypothetical protein PMIN06_006206 [Paraphaeosphaeria minitans]